MVFPSHHDTFGWVLLEAKSFGLPAVVTNAYNRPETVKDGEEGLVVKDPFLSPFLPVSAVPYSEAHIAISEGRPVYVSRLLDSYVEELAQALLRLHEERDLLAKLGLGALRSVQVGGRFGGGARISYLHSRLAP